MERAEVWTAERSRRAEPQISSGTRHTAITILLVALMNFHGLVDAERGEMRRRDTGGHLRGCCGVARGYGEAAAGGVGRIGVAVAAGAGNVHGAARRKRGEVG